jgi:hypothetical protein
MQNNSDGWKKCGHYDGWKNVDDGISIKHTELLEMHVLMVLHSCSLLILWFTFLPPSIGSYSMSHKD